MSEELQRLLECPMCLELYDGLERWPKLLPCQHTFCGVCLVQLDIQGSIACPQCRKTHASPVGGALQLPNNFTMISLLDVHKKSSPLDKESTTSLSKESAPSDKTINDSVRKAIAELARRLHRRAVELGNCDTKRQKVEDKFLAVKSSIDAAFDSRARDLQVRKDSLIKTLAAMRQEELNLVDTQKASVYQYLQKFQKDFAVMRQSILNTKQPTQDQYNQLLTVCQRYTQQIEQYALTIDENLHEISFTDPNRMQLAVSINSYGSLQAASMDKSKQNNESTSKITIPSSSATTATSPTASTNSVTIRKPSTTDISVANLEQSLPHVAGTPSVPPRKNSPASSRSGSPLSVASSRNRAQTMPNINQIPENPITFQSAAPNTSVIKEETGEGSAFAVSGNLTSAAMSRPRNKPESSPAMPQNHSRETTESKSSNTTQSTRTGSTSQSSSESMTSMSMPIPSTSLPISRNPAGGDASRSLYSDKLEGTRSRPSLPSRPPPLGSYTRHASIDFTGNNTRTSDDSNTTLGSIKEQSSIRSAQTPLGNAANSSGQKDALSSSTQYTPPLPPRRSKVNQPNRPRSMSADAGMSTVARDNWAKFDTIGSRSHRTGKERSSEVNVIGSGWFGGSFFERPTGVVILPNNLMAVVDDRNHCITVTTEAGQLVRNLGSQGSGHGEFQFPKCICLNKRGHMIVSDWWNHRIQIWDVNGQVISNFGTKGSEAAQFNAPMGVTCNSTDNIFVCDANNHCVKVFSPEGRYLRQIGKEGSGEGCFICPSHLVVSPGGELLITDSGKHCVQMFSTQGTFLYQFGEWGTIAGKLNCPSGIMIDPSGYLFVSSSGNHRVEVYNPSGSFSASIGTHGSGKAQFDEPIGIAATEDGRMVVCDSGNKRLQVMWP